MTTVSEASTPAGVTEKLAPTDSTPDTRPATVSLRTVCWGLFTQHPIIVGSLAILTLWFTYLALLKAIGELRWAVWFKTWVPGAKFHQYCYDTFVSQTTAHDLFLGVTGIFVGFFVALMIEHANHEKSQVLHGETSRIREATVSLTSLTKGVADEIRQAAEEAKRLIVITDYKRLLEQIGNVIDHASQSSGELLIMNLTASFGYFMTFDSDHVLATDHLPLEKASTNRSESLKSMQQRHYFARWTNLHITQTANETKLKACAIGGEGLPRKKVTYVTLRAKKEAAEATPVPFISGYLHPSLVNAEVRTYDTKADSTLGDLGADSKKLYLVPNSIVAAKAQQDAKQAFEEHLVDDQIHKIRQLRNADIEVTELDEIPFQLYVSLPQEGRDRDSGMCLFMFVNQHTLGRTNNLAAFVTTDPEILGAFKTIIASVVAQGKAAKR